MGRYSKCGDHNPLVYFKLTDEDKWLLIDRLMTFPQYAKSRTSLINKALDYGLPKLIEEEFGEIKPCEEPPKQIYKSRETVQTIPEEKIAEIVAILQEIAMYAELNKSMLCSLFNAVSRDLKGKPPSAELFDNGDLKDTPRYLMRREIQLLKDMGDTGN